MNEDRQRARELNQPTGILGKISGLFISRFRVVYLIIIGILIMGYTVYTGMAREAMPEVSMRMISVSTYYQGVSANDVEALITEPLENVLEGVEDLDEITSTSSTGSSSILLSFKEEADMDDALNTVTTNVAGVSLPDGAMDPVVMEFRSSDFPIMRMTLTGDFSMTELKHYGEVLQEEMESIEGIDEVDVTGGYTREVQVQLNQSEMNKYGVSVSEITTAITNSDYSTPLSSMGLEGEDFNLRIDETLTTVEDIENIVVRADSNSYLLLKDIADVTDSFKTPSEYAYYYVNEGEENPSSEPAIYFQVYREDGYDMVQPATDIKTMLEESKGTLYPESVTVVITQDDSVEVTEELNTVLDSALSGFLVVIIVLFLFIGLNEALIVASVIPLSLLIGVVFLDLNGMTFNTLTLTGFIIALGLLVDNAIVILENVDRLRDMGIDRVTASRVGSNQVAAAVFAAALTTIVAFLPLLVMTGTVGEMIRSLPLTIVFSIIASFIVSIVITPALTSRFLSRYKGGHKSEATMGLFSQAVSIYGSALFVAVLALFAFSDFGIFSFAIAAALGVIMYFRKVKITYGEHDESKSMAARYKGFIHKVITTRKYKVTVIVMSLVLFISSLSVMVIGDVKVELFPVEDPDTININITAPEGYMLDDTRETVYDVEAILYGYEDVESFNTSIGGGEGMNMMNAFPSASNEASIAVDIKEERGRTGLELLDVIREDVKTVAGAEIIVDATLSQGPSSEDISISLLGNDKEVLEKVGEKYYEALLSTEGVINPEFSGTSGTKEVIIEFDELKLGKYGYTSLQFSQTIQQRLTGIRTTTFTENDDEIDITVYVDKDQVNSIADLENLYFTAPNGTSFQFAEVASTSISNAVSSISHDDGKNVVTISADVHPDYDLTATMTAFNSKTDDFELPKGVELESGGGFRDMTDTFSSMVIGLMAAILLVYIILAVQFNSLHQPMVILFSVPMAITGVMFGLQLTGNNLGFYAMMGIIALVGIAVNDAIVLIDYMNSLRRQGLEKYEAIAEGVKTRFTPVFATSLTTIGGILPLAVFNETYGQLGIALIFGLVASTLLTLLVIPVIYSGLDSLANKIKTRTGFFLEEAARTAESDEAMAIQPELVEEI